MSSHSHIRPVVDVDARRRDADGYRDLCAEVLRLAVMDASRGDAGAGRYLAGAGARLHLATVCDALGILPADVRDAVATRGPMRLPTHYPAAKRRGPNPRVAH